MSLTKTTSSKSLLLSKGRKVYVAFNLHTTYAILPLDGSLKQITFHHITVHL